MFPYQRVSKTNTIAKFFFVCVCILCDTERDVIFIQANQAFSLLRSLVGETNQTTGCACRNHQMILNQ